jgi:HK97 family phage major capsid protein
MTLEQIQDLKKRHDNAVAAMRDAATALSVEGLTDVRKSELEATFAKAEKEQEQAYQSFQRSQKAFEAEKRSAELFYDNEERSGRANDKRNPEEVNADFNAVFRKYMIQGEARMTDAERSILEKRGTSTLIAGTNSLGGFTVPVSLANQIIQSMKAYGGVLEVANLLLTDSGNTLNFPTNNDTSAKAVLVAEGSAATVQDTTFAQVAVGAYTYRDLIKLSKELIQDSAFDIEAYVANLMGTRFGRAANESCTTGTGSSQPQGVVTGSTLGKTAASATAITFAEILDLVHSVDPEYRRNGRFMMHDNVLAYIKKLSIGASDARPLWQPSFIVGEPATIDGFQYVINQDMDSTINTASKLILFGDFSKYLVRQSRALEILRNEYLYMGTGEIGLFGFARWDAKLLDTAAVKHLITA